MGSDRAKLTAARPVAARIGRLSRTPRLARLAIAGLVVIQLASCGGGSPSAAPSEQAAGDRGILEFVRCMRAHGIDMADPVRRPGHLGLSIDLPERGPATASAYAACGHYLQPLIQAKQAHAKAIPAAARLGLIHYAECMRTRDIPMLDPTPQGTLNLGNVPGLGNGFGRYTVQFHTADKVCRRLLPASVHDNGTGP